MKRESVPSLNIIPPGGPWMYSSGFAIADPVVVGWNFDDLASFPPDYASSLAQRIGIVVATARPTKSPAPARGQGMSTGAKAGIGIGAALGAVLVGLALFFLLRICRKRKVAASTSERENVVIPEMEGQNEALAKRMSELDSRGVSGLPAELKGSGPDTTHQHGMRTYGRGDNLGFLSRGQ